MARCWLWRVSDERLYRAYRDTSDRIIRCGRLEYITEHLAATAAEPPEVLTYRLAEVGEEWLVGFHAVESWENESFRWSGPVSIVRAGLPVGSYDVQIETRSLRKAPVPLCLGVFFNGHKVPSSSIRFHNGQVAFRVLPSMFEHGPEQRLILTCNPLRPWKSGVPDRRELGLPIFSIAFRPVENTVSGRDDLAASTTRPLAGNDRSQRQQR